MSEPTTVSKTHAPAQEGASSEGEMGLSMSPPAFALHASKPIQCQVGGGQTTNYRVDTARLTMQDLDDPEIRARLEAMRHQELLDLAGRVQDPELAQWLRQRSERGRAGRIDTPTPFITPDGHQEEYRRLTELLQSIAAGAPAILANPPAAQAVLRDNPNAQAALGGIQRAAQVLASRGITTIFTPHLPASTGAKYESISNTMSIRPFGSNQTAMVEVALNVVHELTHQAQDQATERRLASSASGMERFGRTEDLAREREAWTVGTYASLIFEALGHSISGGAAFEYGMMLGPMERDRQNPRNNHHDTDAALTGPYGSQFANNDHMVMYRIALTEENMAVLSHPQGQVVLGEVPASVTHAGALIGHLMPLVEHLPNFRALFQARRPRETFRQAIFVVSYQGRRVIEFGLRNPALFPPAASTASPANGASASGNTPATPRP